MFRKGRKSILIGEFEDGSDLLTGGVDDAQLQVGNPGRDARVAIQGMLHGDYVPVKGAEGEQKRTRLALEVIVDRITYLSPMRRLGETAADTAEDEKSAGGGRSRPVV